MLICNSLDATDLLLEFARFFFCLFFTRANYFRSSSTEVSSVWNSQDVLYEIFGRGLFRTLSEAPSGFLLGVSSEIPNAVLSGIPLRALARFYPGNTPGIPPEIPFRFLKEYLLGFLQKLLNSSRNKFQNYSKIPPSGIAPEILFVVYSEIYYKILIAVPSVIPREAPSEILLEASFRR